MLSSIFATAGAKSSVSTCYEASALRHGVITQWLRTMSLPMNAMRAGNPCRNDPCLGAWGKPLSAM